MKKRPVSLQSSDSDDADNYPSDLLRLERELVLFGFFTPKKKTNKLMREKVIRFERRRRPEDNKVHDVEIRIIAGGTYGLPTVADQDKYLALQSIIQRKLLAGESINPVTFNSVDILRELGVTKGGKTTDEVTEWLHRMYVTSIFKTVRERDAKKKAIEENLRPFRRRVAYGDTLDNGERAVENYVWLDDWLYRNFIENRLINFDLKRYLKLKSTIAKALAIHLHVWMYAARATGTFEKVYGDLCQLLGIENYAKLGEGRVMQQLGPPFEELKGLDFLSFASVERARTASDFKIVLKAGKYLASANPVADVPLLEAGEPSEGEKELLALLPDVMQRGIPEPRARRILTLYSSADELRGQIKRIDDTYRAQKKEIRSAVGYYIRALEEKWQAAPDLTNEQSTQPDDAVDVNLCPDCGGAGYYYPDGYNKGVRLCRHSNLKQGD